MQVGIGAQEIEIALYVRNGILGRADDVQCFERDHLRLDLDAARIAVLTGHQIHTAVAQDIHTLNHCLRRTGSLEAQINTQAVIFALQRLGNVFRALFGQVIDTIRTEVSRQSDAVAAGCNDAELFHAHFLQIHHGEASHRAQTLHHGNVDLREIDAGLFREFARVDRCRAGAGKDRRHHRI